MLGYLDTQYKNSDIQVLTGTRNDLDIETSGKGATNSAKEAPQAQANEAPQAKPDGLGFAMWGLKL